MPAEQIQPIAPSKRTAIVDMLRGWALLGVVLMNYVDYHDVGWNPPKTYHADLLTNILQYTGWIVFAAKSWTMLSMLFGYGFAVLIRNIADKGYNPVKFFTVRMLWLFVIAFVNCCFWWGDILKDYAFMGLVMLLFYKIKPKPAFIFAVVLFFILPALAPWIYKIPSDGEKYFGELLPLYHSKNFFDNVKFNLLGTWYREMISPGYLYMVHLVQLLCFMLGFAAQRVNFFENLADNKKQVKRIFWCTLVGFMLLTIFFPLSQKMKWEFFKYYNVRYPYIIVTMLCTVSALCCLYVNGKLKAFFRALEAIGKMTLTNYMVQNIISFFVFGGVGLALGSTMPFWFYWALPLSIYIAQIYFSKWWLARYNYGLVEWIWRQLSYNKHLPLRKVKN
ncbi:DUF418 domain-containing protein [Mucilaginibacter mali]|uniref:DUF418 domain-containing protein n=1 Tax=Mucilaginibacter mali TaxID=2740462 RepID=A0A7D4TWH7_9SPHI|nr:DUF418 domain-containing protein [Mucilaginibacter mali]QKJ29497.1 DUF418 domain-containing protein [Mucilaginibacter mali]